MKKKQNIFHRKYMRFYKIIFYYVVENKEKEQ